MKRRLILLVVALGVMIVIAASASRKQTGLLVLEWAAKAPDETFPVAVLIEMGLKDAKANDWSGRATVGGARVVHREGYRFRSGEGDKLTDPDGWQASSHRGLRLPPRQPALLRLEPIATVRVSLRRRRQRPTRKPHPRLRRL